MCDTQRGIELDRAHSSPRVPRLGRADDDDDYRARVTPLPTADAASLVSTMVLSAVFITDLKGKVIISRNYRGDIPMSASARFTHYVQDRDDSEQRPVFTEDGYTFVYLKVRCSLSLSVISVRFFDSLTLARSCLAVAQQLVPHDCD